LASFCREKVCRLSFLPTLYSFEAVEKITNRQVGLSTLNSVCFTLASSDLLERNSCTFCIFNVLEIK
jgi:hypothetical protein